MEDVGRRIQEGLELLRARWGARIAATPARSDPKPEGDGPPNRHGMPREPPGQNLLEQDEWPVLDLGETPNVSADRWRLVVDGACERPFELTYAELLALPQVDEELDFHCVTGWSVLDLRFTGVRLETIAALARPTEAATHVMCHGADGYTTNFPLEEALKPDVLVAHAVGGKALSTDHGGPVRGVVPELYAWKGAKWLSRVEFMAADRRGYWEIRGYSNTAHPWRDDRMW